MEDCRGQFLLQHSKTKEQTNRVGGRDEKVRQRENERSGRAVEQQVSKRE